MSKLTDDVLKARISKNTRALRAHLGMTQEQLSVASGLTVQTVSRVETGRTLPRLPVAVRLASGLGVSLDTLMNSDDAAPWTTLTPEEWEWVRLLRTLPTGPKARVAALVRDLSPESMGGQS